MVVDATVLFAAIISEGRTSELFFDDRLRLVATSYLIDEFQKNTGVIAGLCACSESAVIESFDILKERLEILPIIEFPGIIWSRAQKLAPHSKDVPYFALALHLGSGIWSRDKGFRKQSEVKVYTTPELIDMFGVVQQ